MPQTSLGLFLIFLSTHFSLLPASLPALPDPLPLSAATLPPPSFTIPANPEQSDVSSSPTSTSSPSSSTCSLSLPADLINSLTAACPHDSPLARCCPSLAASLYAAFAPSALSLPLPSLPSSLPDLPALPDDSESCASGIESALRSRGVDLPRLNATCDVAYCYCGVRLRRLTCAGGVFVEEEGRWAPKEATGRRLQRECRRPGAAGCSRCLQALNQLSANVSISSNPKQNKNDRECQLMGLTWLLSKNRPLYLPTATSVLRAFMAVPGLDEVGPATCSIPLDEMPFAVGSNEINGESSPIGHASTLLGTMFFFIISSMVL